MLVFANPFCDMLSNNQLVEPAGLTINDDYIGFRLGFWQGKSNIRYYIPNHINMEKRISTLIPYLEKLSDISSIWHLYLPG